MVLGVRMVYLAASVCILSVLSTRGTLQYVGINISSLLVIYVLGVRPVFPAAAVCIFSVLPTRGNLQYVGINNKHGHGYLPCNLRDVDCENIYEKLSTIDSEKRFK